MGQAIWDKDNGYKLVVNSYSDRQEEAKLEYFFSDLSNVVPFEETEVDFYIKTDGASGKYKSKISLEKNGKNIINGQDWQFEVLPLPQLQIKVNLYPKLKTNGNDFKIQIFDDKEEMVFQKKIKVVNNKGLIADVQNIALEKKYRVVVLKPYYLPRQEYVIFKRGLNNVGFKLMYPADFNKDGKFSGEDISAFFKNLKLFSIFLP